MTNIVKIPLPNGQFTIIDSDDFIKVSQHKWYARKSKNDNWYATSIRFKNLHLHRFIMGVTDSKIMIDHIDHNGLNNCKSNLRIVTNSQNMMNMRPNKNTSSKFKGVYWNNEKKKWSTQIRINGRTKQIGHFKNESDAAKAYNEMAKIHYKEFAFLNPV